MSKFVRTCTHDDIELVDGECLDCKTLEKISKNFPKKFNTSNKKRKTATITYSLKTYDEIKAALKNGEH
tara:strand:+ start:12672 stop:12878 length:207 start_codon:yes stop_codon:yes gene_type:complete